MSCDGAGAAVVPSSRIVVGATLRQHVCEQIYMAIGAARVQQHLPVAHPISLERADFARLRAANYVVGEKSDGVRYTLVLTLHPDDGEPIALMIDRHFHMFAVSVFARTSYFSKTTLFDGELVVAGGAAGAGGCGCKLRYLVFDTMAVAGVSMMQRTYAERRAEMQRVLECSLYTAAAGTAAPPQPPLSASAYDFEARRIAHVDNVVVSGLQTIEFVPKRFYPLADLDIVLRQQREHCSDGLVIVPVDAPIVLGRASGIFKWKHTHTIDLRVIGGTIPPAPPQTPAPANFTYLDGTFNNGTTSGAANESVLTELTPWVFTIDAASAAMAANSVWEFEIASVGGGGGAVGAIVLRAVRARTDKDTPNDRDTVVKTLQNVVEAIGEHELIAELTTRHPAFEARSL